MGGFYRRFTTKEAALYELNQHVMDQLAEHFEREFRPEELGEQPLSEVIRAYVGMGVSGFIEHRAILRQLFLLNRINPDPEIRARLVKFNRYTHDRFRAVLWERIDEIQHPQPREAIDLGLIVTSAGMRELTIYSDTRTGMSSFEQSRLITELTRVYCAYLGLPFPEDSP